MMGDNRDNSQDSRYLNVVGYVPIENYVGRADIIFFSISPNAVFVEALGVAVPHTLDPLLQPDLMSKTASNGKAPLARLSDRLGYEFADAELLHQALTHGSSGRKAKDYERLEFLATVFCRW